MTTGVKWSEISTDADSDIVKFYTQPVDFGIDETVSYMRHLPSEAKPGKKWVYKKNRLNAFAGCSCKRRHGKTLSKYLSLKIWASYGK